MGGWRHFLRPEHLAQLKRILDDPEASANDRYVALDLLKNANVASSGVLPMCQDTGTAIVLAKRGHRLVTDGDDERHLSEGIHDVYRDLNLRYSQLSAVTMWYGSEHRPKLLSLRFTFLPPNVDMSRVSGKTCRDRIR